MVGKTSRDVANALGIAQSTVSRAFTPGASISAALRARIHAAAAEIGYRPNLLARGLVAGRSRLIGTVIAPETNLLYPELLYELSRQLAERGQQLLLLPASGKEDVAQAIERLRAYRVDAVIGTGIIGPEVAAAIVADGVPLITFNRLFAGISGVSCDFGGGFKSLGRSMLAAGLRSFGFIGGPQGSWVSEQALAGLRTALATTPDATLACAQAAYSYGSAAQALEELASNAGVMPTVIFCVNDSVAAGCLDHLRPRFGRASREVALLTFLGLSSGSWAGYDLSGLSQPTRQMVKVAVDLLLDETRAQAGEHVVLAPTQVVGSTAPALSRERGGTGTRDAPAHDRVRAG